jgi:hypothetical protein
MNNVDTLTSYISDLRRIFSQHLKPGVALEIYIHPSKVAGAVIEIHLKIHGLNKDEIKPEKESVLDILQTIPQNFIKVSPSSSGVRFGGTNFYLDEDKILIIKGEDSPADWSPEAAEKDVSQLSKSMSQRIRS